MFYTIPDLKIDEDLKLNLNNIEKVIDDLNKRRDKGLSEELEKKIKKQLMISHVYHSNAIEGNKLTLRETELILNNMVINERPLKDELEAQDLANATDYLENLISGYETINYKTLIELHQLILKTSNQENAGVYRKGNVKIGHSDHIPPDHLHIDENMKKMFQWMNRNSSKYHPLEMGAIIHHWITWVHPFSDGNGRVARLFLNFFLIQKGYPEITIRIEDRDNYYDCLVEGDKGKIEKLISFISENVRNSVDVIENFINEEERTKEWSGKYKHLAEQRIEEAKSRHKHYYNIWQNNMIVFQNLMERHLDEISDNLPEIDIEYHRFDPISMNKYLAILEGKKVTHNWIFRFMILNDLNNVKWNYFFSAKLLKLSKPLRMLGVDAIDKKTGKKAMQEITSRVIISIFCRRGGHNKNSLLREEIDLEQINSQEDKLTFSIKNRQNIKTWNYRTGAKDFVPQIINDTKSSPESIVQKFIDQILKYYFGIYTDSDLIED